MQSGGRKFLTDQPMSFATYEEEKIDIHHIFPKVWCQANKVEAKRMDCIVNKTAISARTNRIIGGVPPAKYLAALERRGGIAPETLDRVLATHLISTEALRADNFEAFFEVRREALIGLIRTAMGKTVAPTEEWIEPAGEPIEGEDDSDDEAEALEAA
jgi:hypothetical protein